MLHQIKKNCLVSSLTTFQDKTMPKPTTSQNFNGTTLLHNNNNNNNNHSNNSSNSTNSVVVGISSSVLNNNSCTAAAQIMLNGFTKNSTPINNSVNFAQNNTTSDKLKGGTATGDTKNNNLNSSSSAYVNVTDFDLPNLEAPKKVNNVKLHLPSPMYDRYPSKNLGQMKVYPITTPDKEEPGQGNSVEKVRSCFEFFKVDHLCRPKRCILVERVII